MRALITAATTSSPHLAAFGERCAAALESVGIIISCCAHQRRIVDDILTLSKLDSKLLEIAPSLTKLDSMLFELEKMFEADAQKFDVSLRLNKDLGKVEWAMLDTGRLTQVLTNLITNAAKFTHKEAERTITINVGISQKPPSEQDLDVEFVPAGIARSRGGTRTGSDEEFYLHFTVSDTGCGFDEEQKSRIFERFSQASPRTHSKYGGSGLGLFISREMIELQGGEIGVRSSPGHGACFAFYIAAHTADPPLSTQTQQQQQQQQQQQNTTSPSQTPLSRNRTLSSATSTPKFSILVVEDNLVNQKVLRMQLQKLGHTVHVVSHGREALDFLATTSCWQGQAESPLHVSVVLMDIEMPVMNGLDCTRKIREAESEGKVERRLPIIAVSANAREGQVRNAMECGVDDAISKPFRVADLMPIIERLVLV
jgi:CheY-like chemotaxis protein/anti-sigma regulatory factor (Ser/Thr protein kinase)